MAKVFHTGITDEKQIKKTLQEEGFSNIFTWTDSQGTHYPTHTHPHYEVRWIVDGTLQIEEDGNIIELNPGDRIESEPNTPHAAYAPTTVTYVCASR